MDALLLPVYLGRVYLEQAWLPVCMSTDDDETIASGVLAANGEGRNGTHVPGEEVLAAGLLQEAPTPTHKQTYR